MEPILNRVEILNRLNEMPVNALYQKEIEQIDVHGPIVEDAGQNARVGKRYHWYETADGPKVEECPAEDPLNFTRWMGWD